MKKEAIFHGLTALFSVLVYAFFALPFYSITTQVLTESSVESISGYKFLDEALKLSTRSGNMNFAIAMGILTLILAGVVFLSAIFMLLCDFGVVKNEKVAGIAKWVVLGSAALFVLFALLNLIANSVFVAKDIQANFDIGNALGGFGGATMNATAGWALTIITLMLSVCSLALPAYEVFSKLKKQK